MNTKLKLLPMDISWFLHEYDIEPETFGQAIAEYAMYLQENADIHFYDDKTMEQWLAGAIDMYLHANKVEVML